MWKIPNLTEGHGERKPASRTGCMAHRKGLVTARVGWFLAGGLLLAFLMAGRVVVLNQMASMRVSIAVLGDQKDFLETESANLLEKWNHETSPKVVCARAEAELGLISPDQPDLVLVKLPGDQDKSRWGWPHWLEGLGGGDPVQASESHLSRPDGGMVHLSPVAMLASNSQEVAH